MADRGGMARRHARRRGGRRRVRRPDPRRCTRRRGCPSSRRGCDAEPLRPGSGSDPGVPRASLLLSTRSATWTCRSWLWWIWATTSYRRTSTLALTVLLGGHNGVTYEALSRRDDLASWGLLTLDAHHDVREYATGISRKRVAGQGSRGCRVAGDTRRPGGDRRLLERSGAQALVRGDGSDDQGNRCRPRGAGSARHARGALRLTSTWTSTSTCSTAPSLREHRVRDRAASHRAIYSRLLTRSATMARYAP